MRRRDRGDDRDVRADQPGQRGQLAGMVHAHLEHAEARRRAASAPGSAARRYGCCSSSPSDARGPARARSSAANSASLVPVLPTEPVTPTIRAAAARARGAAEIVQRRSRVGDQDMRVRDRLADRSRPAAPAAKALSTKRWPSVASPFSAMNRSPGLDLARIEGDARRPSNSPWAAPPVGRGDLGRRSTSGAHAAHSRATVDVVERQHRCRRRSGPARGPCRRAGRCRPARPRRSPPRSPRAGRRPRVAPGAPARMSRRIAAGSSLRGLSSVTITRSASRAADRAHFRRACRWSRSPPAPNTMISRPLACGRSAVDRRFERVGRVRIVDIDRRAGAA